ncbi:MAG: FAD-dependent oxidoreductase [Desulfobacteraceae bacterium]|nr:FAD-dependent oxidoreductase [Desulfobacteraceae bacterium]MBC2751175.1 FAD-dependent oxidoreductase [Desulfobacteraceae bacterium]
MTVFPHLFNPITIGPMTAKNRLLMPAMSINFGVDQQGFVTEQLIDYFLARARGGAGMLLVGGGAVHPTGVELPDLPKLWNDACIPSLTRMVDAVRPYDACFGVQLMHGGRQSYHDQKVAPSAIPAPAVVKGVPKALELVEIDELVAAFGDAARRCRAAGFDFIEIHAAHGYLINQFMARNSNKREDHYGGSFDNRIRFLMELLADIKAKAGRDYPVGIRINGNDFIKDGWTLDDTLRLAPLLETAGADYLHVSAGVYGSTELTIPSVYAPQGCFVHLAEAVKQVVSLPVVAVGRIKHADMADRIIAEGRADAVAMGRALLADPELPNKARANGAAIRPCIGCCLGCIHAVLQLEPGGCVVNPDVGREYLLKDEDSADASRVVLVVGGGPAGLAAARMGAVRGHRVILIEEGNTLGGLFRLATRAPGRQEAGDILAYFEAELARLQVDIRYQTLLTAGLLDDIAPDIAVLATGSLPDTPIIKGFSGTKMAISSVVEVMGGELPEGDQVIVLGGGQSALMLADFLAEAGKTVVVLNRGRHFGEEMSSNDRFYLRERLNRNKVQLYKNVVVEAFLPRGVRFRAGEKTDVLEDMDALVISEGMTAIRPDRRLFKDRVTAVHLIGDAKEPRNLMLAIAEGEELGRSL